MPMLTLAAGVASVLLAIAGLLLFVIVGVLALRALHANILAGRDDADGDGAFTLHDLRRMRDAGEISEEEFAHMRAIVTGSVSGDAGVRTAAPGVDLTGAPLPRPDGAGPTDDRSPRPG